MDKSEVAIVEPGPWDYESYIVAGLGKMYKMSIWNDLREMRRIKKIPGCCFGGKRWKVQGIWRTKRMEAYCVSLEGR